MHRIDRPGHVNNRFTMGDPQTGQRATQMGSDWPNAVQEEIANVIEHAGIVLDKAQHTQLRDAITAIAQNIIGDGGEGPEPGVPPTRQVSTAGAATGGGPLSADITITVPIATAAEIRAGVVGNKVVTPEALAAATIHVNGVTGYRRRHDGAIEMWGVATALANGTTVVTLPTTFPSTCTWAGCEGGSNDTDASHNGPYVSGRGTGSISIFNALNSSVFVSWKAEGY